jgi:hypothetical protein
MRRGLGRRPGERGWYSYAPLTRGYSAYFVTKDAVVPGAAVTAAFYLKRRRAPHVA